MKPSKAVWTFEKLGGVSQARLLNGDDFVRLEFLDQKLWMALAMPTRGIEFDPRTADLIDTDKDGRIRPPEVLAALRWINNVLHDPGELVAGSDVVVLNSIKDPEILAGARRTLANLGRPDDRQITLADVVDRDRIFAGTRFNGDGVITPDATDDQSISAAIRDIMSVTGEVLDKSGHPGINQKLFQDFKAGARAFLDWSAKPDTEPSILPLGQDTSAAAAAVDAVKAKLDDYFTRCRLAEFDRQSEASLNAGLADHAALSGRLITPETEEIAALPIARIAPGNPLIMDQGINPAWAKTVRLFFEQAVRPLLGADTGELDAGQWETLQSKLAPYRAWMHGKPVNETGKLGRPRLEELLCDKISAVMEDLFQRDLALQPENAQLAALEKMIRFKRDLHLLLANYVNFSQFFGRGKGLFEAGTLYLDGRACHLCLEVADPDRHAALAGMSGAFLVYCKLVRQDMPAKSIVAVVTNGGTDNLMVGRNGLFYDRQGRDWDATVTKIVANPISIREAFWSPYKKFARFIEEQIARRAQTAEQTSTNRLSDTAGQLANVDQTDKSPPTAGGHKRIDLGAIALIGTAIGGVSALVGGFLQALFGLGFWLPLGLLGVLLMISGPSMLLAALKLRQRNIAPILDAVGWAVNARMGINPVFGAALTELARLPPNARRVITTPYSDRFRRWKIVILLILAALLGYFWWSGCKSAGRRQAGAHGVPAAPTLPDAE